MDGEEGEEGGIKNGRGVGDSPVLFHGPFRAARITAASGIPFEGAF